MWNAQTNEERNQVKDGVKNMSSTMQEGKEAVQKEAAEMSRQLGDKLKQSKDQLRQAATTLEKQLRNDPWPVVAGIAVGSLLIGYVLGTSRR